jgi:hypothetical protein
VLEAVLEARPLLEAEEVVRSAGPEIRQALPVFLVRLFTLPFSSIGSAAIAMLARLDCPAI